MLIQNFYTSLELDYHNISQLFLLTWSIATKPSFISPPDYYFYNNFDHGPRLLRSNPKYLTFNLTLRVFGFIPSHTSI